MKNNDKVTVMYHECYFTTWVHKMYYPFLCPKNNTGLNEVSIFQVCIYQTKRIMLAHYPSNIFVKQPNVFDVAQ